MSLMLLPQRSTEPSILFLRAHFYGSTVQVRDDAHCYYHRIQSVKRLASDRIFWSTKYKIKPRGMGSTRISTVMSSVTRIPCTRNYSGPSRLDTASSTSQPFATRSLQKSNQWNSSLLCSWSTKSSPRYMLPTPVIRHALSSTYLDVCTDF